MVLEHQQGPTGYGARIMVAGPILTAPSADQVAHTQYLLALQRWAIWQANLLAW